MPGLHLPESVRHSRDPLDLRAASRDLWPGGTLDFWQGRPAPLPQAVCWPDSTQQVALVLRAASEAGVPVVTYGAGSGVCGGARGMEGALVLDTKLLETLEVDADRRTIRVGAGVNGQRLEDALAGRGLTLGHSPSSIGCSTVGGWAAARSAGQFSSKYGVFEDMVLGLDLVTPGAGTLGLGCHGALPESLLDVALGSEGTLGVISELTLRVHALPEKRWLRGYRFPSVEAALSAMRALMQAELWPAVLRLYDPIDTRIGGRTKPKKEGAAPSRGLAWLKAVGELPGLKERSLSLPLALPTLVNRVFEGMARGCLVVVGWEGAAGVVDAQVAAAKPILDGLGEDLGEGPGERWYHSRHAVSYKLMPIFERGGFADTMEVASRWTELEPMYHSVRAALRQTTVVMAHMSHLYPEGGSIYFSFAGKGDRAVYDQTWKAALDAVLAAGGTVTHHHGVGSLKAEAASREIGAAVRFWEAQKQAWDPAGLLNPGRLFVAGKQGAMPPARAADRLSDGLVEVPAAAGLAERVAAAQAAGGELRWTWAHALPRAQRWPWQTGSQRVEAELDGLSVRLGRGPRSAAGPDLREALVAACPDARVAVSLVGPGARWMGEADCEQPWLIAQALLRADFRPAVLAVRDGRLVVGFRGPAAEALGALASARVPGGLKAVAYEALPLASGPLVACTADDQRACWATAEGLFRPAGEA